MPRYRTDPEPGEPTVSSSVSAPVDASASADVLKPDFGARRKHFIFGE